MCFHILSIGLIISKTGAQCKEKKNFYLGIDKLYLFVYIVCV